MSKFSIPTPSINIDPSPKFKLGSEIKSIEQLRHHTLAFSFEYSCFNNTPISINYSGKETSDYLDILVFLKHLSLLTIGDLNDNCETYHFHEIDINFKYYLKSFLKDNFKNNTLDYSQIPTIYQIAYYNDDTAPRICGFFGSLGLFYILWWDFHHLIHFSCAHHKASSFNENWFLQYIN